MTLPRLEVAADAFPAGADVIAVAVRAEGSGVVVDNGARVLSRLRVDAPAVLEARQAKGSPGEVIEVPVGRGGVTSVLLVGVGDGAPAALRKAGAAVVRRSASGRVIAAFLPRDVDADGVRAFAEAAGIAAHSFSRRSVAKPSPLETVRVVVPDLAVTEPAVAAARVTAGAVHLARDLAQTPSSEKSPRWMAERARDLATSSGLDARVWDDAQLSADGFGGIIAVGRGSARPPRLVQLSYSPDDAIDADHVVLVGKGITFDTGGLSLKPLDAMKAMKTDMAGAAAVLAAMTALRDLGVRRRVTALLPLAENMPGASATRPSDVIRHWDGQTVEVLNTDAEGRLVLADALGYAVATLAPDTIIDLATLTGAATLALGRRDAPLYTTSAELGRDLVAAGAAAGERLWPMPLVDAYRDGLDSEVADMRNIADPARGYQAGSIVAALFLREFVGSVPWAHLDIAGTGRADGDDDEISKGATGFGTRTLLRYLARKPSTSR